MMLANDETTSTVGRLTKMLMVGTTLLALLAWLYSGATVGGTACLLLPGVVIAVVLLRSTLAADGGFLTQLILYVFLMLGGWVGIGLIDDADRPVGLVMAVHTLWIFVFGPSLVVRQFMGLNGGKRGAVVADRLSARQARDAELAYAARMEAEANYQSRATRPGQMTGYEPAELADIDLDANRPALMFGDPGTGLSGSGFDAWAVERGAAGEVNFAKALAKAGLLDRFATFWSVHMPDKTQGASRLETDIDCVVVTGKSVWLLDMKNYTQGDVTWRVESDPAEGASKDEFLVAFDNVTGGVVGTRRKMTWNMSMANEAFRSRFQRIGSKLSISPAVVLMPQDDGTGVVQNVTWKGGIPTASLPDLLHWLSKEPPFKPDKGDGPVVMAILKPLLKDESGSALRLGQGQQRRRSTPRPAAQAPAPTPAVPVAPEPAPVAPAPEGAAATAPDTAATAARECAECGTTIQADWQFCYQCGAQF